MKTRSPRGAKDATRRGSWLPKHSNETGCFRRNIRETLTLAPLLVLVLAHTHTLAEPLKLFDVRYVFGKHLVPGPIQHVRSQCKSSRN